MAAPVKPTPPTPHASRSSPSTFPALADATIDYALVDGPDYIEAAATFAEAQAAIAEAAAQDLLTTFTDYSGDVDALTSNGVYKLATGVTNAWAGAGDNDFIFNFYWDATNSVQYGYDGAAVTYIRSKVGGSWGGWLTTYFDGGSPWVIVETLNGGTGSPTTLETSDFEAGYDYRFIHEGLSHNDAGARRLAVEFYGVALAAYVAITPSSWTQPVLIEGSGTVASTDYFDGVSSIEAPRVSQDIHLLTTVGSAEVSGYGDPLTRVPLRGEVMVTFFASSDAIQKVKFEWTGLVAFDAGTIRVEKKRRW